MQKLLMGLVFLVSASNASSQANIGDLSGVWEPISKVYWEFGDLTITSKEISWGEKCKGVPFSMLKVEGDEYYLELLGPSSCFLRENISHVILVAKGSEEIEISICNKREELNKKPGDRLCSWGVLNKKELKNAP